MTLGGLSDIKNIRKLGTIKNDRNNLKKIEMIMKLILINTHQFIYLYLDHNWCISNVFGQHFNGAISNFSCNFNIHSTGIRFSGFTTLDGITKNVKYFMNVCYELTNHEI